MYVSPSVSVDRSRLPSLAARNPALLLLVFLGACGGSSGGPGQSGVPGEEDFKPNGEPFIVDPNQSGGATSFQVAEVRWGRLVDIHQTDANEVRIEDPVYEGFVIDASVTTNPSLQLRLDRNPLTQRERLTIVDEKGIDADDPTVNGVQVDLFAMRLAEVGQLPLVSIKDDDGSSPPPFTTIPRNACIVVRFNDCLRDDSAAQLQLANAVTVKVFAGYPPVTFFPARLQFDPNHGALLGGSFHSTRVLVDTTVSVEEAASTNLAVNQIGLPASVATSTATNLSIRIPTEIDQGSGQVATLTNLAGRPLDADANGPVDPTVPTVDVVRAARSGNSTEPSNGFLPDSDQPRLVGNWPVTVDDVTPVGTDGFEFLVDLTFASIDCKASPREGDVILVGGALLEVTQPQPLMGQGVSQMGVRSAEPVLDDLDPNTPDPDDLLDAGTYQAPFVPGLVAVQGCWVNFTDVTTFPATGVSTLAQISVRFSEPMDPASLSPFRGFLLVNDEPAGGISAPNSQNTLIGSVLPNGDLTGFSYDPLSPMPHVANDPSQLHVDIGAAKDLAGNSLLHAVGAIPFALRATDTTQSNDAIVLRFDSSTNDEYEPNGDPGALGDGRADLRGTFFFDTARGSIRGRPVALGSWPVDRGNRVPAQMVPFPAGIFTPLNPLGAKVQSLWRYCDLAWAVDDETKYNLDVIGLNWSPVGGLVMSDFFDLFEIRLGHSLFLPDEACCMGTGGTTGLPRSPATFEQNFLPEPHRPGEPPGAIVHNRALGYTVSGADLFNATTGTPMMPFPLNRGLAPLQTYTWRDTAITTTGGGGDPLQKGIPTEAEAGAGVPNLPAAGSLGGPGLVPSFGLPLLVEIKCFPSDRGLGMNRFDINLGSLLGVLTQPGFRAYSAGGVNNLGVPTQVLPDSQTTPIGNVNPTGNLPGSDSVFYLGQLDTVVRVSRIHSVWLDAGILPSGSPRWKPAVLEPATANQPAGTRVEIEFRTATGFVGSAPGTAPFDASRINVYGEAVVATEFAPAGLRNNGAWTGDITIGNGQRYLQVRLTFVNNITTGVGPELSGLALPYDF